MELSPKDEFEELEDKVLYRRTFTRMLISIISLVSITIGSLFFINNFGDNFFIFIIVIGLISIKTIMNSIQYRFIYNFNIEQDKVILSLVNIWGKKRTKIYQKDQIDKLNIVRNELIISTSLGKEKYIILTSTLNESRIKLLK